MPMDLDAYRQRIRAAVGRPSGIDAAARMPSGPGLNSQTGSNVEPMSMQRGAATAQAAPMARGPSTGMTLDQATQPAPAVAGDAPAQGKQQIPIGPPGFKPKFDNAKLSSAKTPADVMQAMKPASKKTYLNWWEQKYGAIDQKWNQVMGEIGKRPDPRRRPSREEMFDMLLEFGLQMIKNSQNNNLGGAVAASVGGAVEGHVGRRALEQDRYDAQAALAGKGRSEEMKSIGTYGDALKGQAELDMRDAEQTMRGEQMLEAETRRKKMEGEAPETLDTDSGTVQWDPATKSWVRSTVEGKQITRKTVQGKGTGAGGGRDTRTANRKNIEDLMDRGVPEQLAIDIVYRRVKDWSKAFTDIVRDRMRNFATREEAEADAEEIISGLAGEDWRKQPTNAQISKDDPLTLR